jgi:predicted nucleotidyltransferase
MREMRVREGDFIETIEGLIFDVKGLIHPPDRVISFLRYVPSDDGERKRHGVRYRKIYDLEKRWAFLREHFPEYLYFDNHFGRELQAVPMKKVRIHYDPKKKLNELLRDRIEDKVEMDAVELARTLKEAAGIPIANIGISGSILVGLQESNSDLDLIIYGANSSKKVCQTLRKLLTEGKILRPYDLDDLKRLYKFRSMEMAMKFEEFCNHEQRKVLQGSYRGRDYFVRCLRDSDGVQDSYESFKCRRLGKARVSAVVSNDLEAIFTPCIYEVQNVSVIEGANAALHRLVSYRGRFCEQARTGEKVIAFGELEQVMTSNGEYSQLVVGESSHDFILRV